jgi:hypothetical protein
MNDTTDDPVLDYLRLRVAEWEHVKADAYSRIDEIEKLMEQLIDGRSRVSKRQRIAAKAAQHAAASDAATQDDV